MKKIFIYLSDGFPTKKKPKPRNINFEQGNALKKYKVHFLTFRQQDHTHAT